MSKKSKSKAKALLLGDAELTGLPLLQIRFLAQGTAVAMQAWLAAGGSLAHKAKLPNYRDLSLLHAAVLMDKPNTLKLLIEAGAALDEPCVMFDGPVCDETDGNRPNIPQTALMLSVALTKDTESMITLLDAGADPGIETHDSGVLHMAGTDY
jgi:hypothetical protein